jgi:hypothetical protein
MENMAKSDAVKKMALGGNPGASLRAFRDYLPNAEVHGPISTKAYFPKKTEI